MFHQAAPRHPRDEPPGRPHPARRWLIVLGFALGLLGCLMPAVAQSTLGAAQRSDAPDATEPDATIRLRQPAAAASVTRERDAGARVDVDEALLRQRPPSEFELYVNRLVFPELEFVTEDDLRIRRLGTDLTAARGRDREAIDFSPLVPPGYLIAPGDELVISIWGSVDAELRLFVDRSGRITIPRVGTVMVSGVRYGDVTEVLRQRIAQTFKNFQVSVSLGQLRGVRVFVTGFVPRPGAYTVNSLSGMAAALVRAGGPSASGSFRDIQLRRNGQQISKFDLYDLLLFGNRSADLQVQADDVIHVGPIGPQVAVVGSVNQAAIFELRPGETVADALRMAGGFSAVADTTRLSLERVDERTTVRVVQVDMAAGAATALRSGDVLRAFNAVDLAAPLLRQTKRVRIEGEVLRPGDYLLPPSSTMADALHAAGGLTPSAFVFGTNFTRESVRRSQQENYERALRNLETDIALSTSTQRITSADEAAAQAGRSAATARLIEKLRSIKPTGRVVLQMPPDSRELPNLVLEDGDRLSVPSVPTSVGVFGSVFNAGNYLREDGRTLSDYLRQAGGPTRARPAAPRAAPMPPAPSCCAPTARWSATCKKRAGAAACAAASRASRRCPATRCSCPRSSTRPPSCNGRKTGRRSWRSSRLVWRRS